MKSKNIFNGRYGHVLLGFLVGVGIVLFLVVYNMLASGASDDDLTDKDKTHDKARSLGPDTADIVGDYFFRTGSASKATAKEDLPDPEHEETVSLEDVADDAGEDVAAETSHSDPSPVATSVTSSQSSSASSQPKSASQQTTSQPKSQTQKKQQDNRIHPTIEKLEN